MRFAKYALSVAFALALAHPASMSAQQAAAPALETGKWTGTVTPPDGQTADVTYDIATKNDTITITIDAGQFGVFPASAIKLEAGKLTFTFTPGPEVLCTLTRKEDGSFAGDCSDSGGMPAHMTMVPPKKQPAGS